MRGSFPRAKAPGAVKQAALSTELPVIALVVIEPPLDLVQPAMTFGRIVPAPYSVDSTFGAALDSASGNPLAKVVIPAIFQPDTNLLPMPVTPDR
jgi:hypothetical protein